jgi:hypothetical protein
MAAIAMAALLGGATACSGSGSVGNTSSTGGGGSMSAASSMPSSPTAWCMRSPERSRCMGRSSNEHEICAQNPANYDSCRFAMDQMHGP